LKYALKTNESWFLSGGIKGEWEFYLDDIHLESSRRDKAKMRQRAGRKNGVDRLTLSKKSINSESIQNLALYINTSVLQACRSLFEK